jgi:hypothetical protein
VTVGSPFVLDVCFLGTSSDFAALNGGSSVPGPFGTNPTSSALSVGNTVDDLSFNWIGDIYEVVILPAEATSGQRTSLLSYFSTRYGIAT